MKDMGGNRRRAWVAFAITSIVILGVLVLLPVAVNSLFQDVQLSTGRQLYDVFTGQPYDPTAADESAEEPTFLNIAFVGLEESDRTATLIVSGHRKCTIPCPRLRLTLFAMGNPEAKRMGLPPSVEIFSENPGAITSEVVLPVEGDPQRYPFDTYRITLGLLAEIELVDGSWMPVPKMQIDRTGSVFTLQDQVNRLVMEKPIAMTPNQMFSPGDPYVMLAAEEIKFKRPAHIQILSVLLVLLITTSGFFALFMRALPDLLLGIGGIILGIWGVRNVVVQGNLPDITLIDSILSIVILLLLLVVAIRAARFFLATVRGDASESEAKS
ncbi:MAG: hypothetical protein ACKOCK_00635 [Chloroflexota bacterium]